MTQAGLPWTGGGPLRIAEECSALNHNSLAAGRGRVYTVNGRMKQIGVHCVCPRTLVLIAEDNRKRRERAQRKAKTRPVDRGPRVLTNVAIGAWVENGVHVPDLSAGLCRTPEGLHFFDLVITGIGNEHRAGVIGAKKLCGGCPVQAECARYVCEGEGSHPGIWRGVWAGMTASERRGINHVES